MHSNRLAVGCASGLALMVWVAIAHADSPSERDTSRQPHLQYGNPIVCTFDDGGRPIRMQCDPERRECLYSRACDKGRLEADCTPAERLQYCTNAVATQSFAAQKAAGMQFVEAGPETPPGFQRDDRDRVFQTEFDMNRRVWIGGGWSPMVGEAERQSLGRAFVETGIQTEWTESNGRYRGRATVLQTRVWINSTSAEGMLLRYSDSRDSETPLMRVTTFWPPTRHDVYFDLGFWAEVLGVELRPRASPDDIQVRIVGLGGGWDLWRDAEMRSYVRLRAGGGFDDHYERVEGVEHRLAATPIGALESDLLLDRAGLHRLRIGSIFEAPLRWEDDEHAPPKWKLDFENEVSYEVILLAVNDQPVTLNLGARGGYRDDLPDPYRGWEVSGEVGLRVNFWAPTPEPPRPSTSAVGAIPPRQEQAR